MSSTINDCKHTLEFNDLSIYKSFYVFKVGDCCEGFICK